MLFIIGTKTSTKSKEGSYKNISERLQEFLEKYSVDTVHAYECDLLALEVLRDMNFKGKLVLYKLPKTVRPEVQRYLSNTPYELECELEIKDEPVKNWLTSTVVKTFTERRNKIKAKELIPETFAYELESAAYDIKVQAYIAKHVEEVKNKNGLVLFTQLNTNEKTRTLLAKHKTDNLMIYDLTGTALCYNGIYANVKDKEKLLEQILQKGE